MQTIKGIIRGSEDLNPIKDQEKNNRIVVNDDKKVSVSVVA